MATLKITTENIIGKIKPMHAVNNGPIRARNDQTNGNFPAYKAARIPYARNHDASHCATYGREHCVDITAVFPNFDADENDPAAYDFVLTDVLIKNTLDAGTETFYRLGQSIEHWAKKYGTIPPKDFHKWARICEHIIRHYNEGWADGFHYNIEYWEIWNEADLDPDWVENKRTWGGTYAEYYELYAITATHLKSCFPHLKIGGPALACDTGTFMTGFMERLTKDGGHVPLDFFSWHIYTTDPYHIARREAEVRAKLEKYGYGDIETNVNEWNYVRDWSENFQYSIRTIIGMKGAAFTAACMCVGQNSTLDMMMYYDARPTGFNGMFGFYTYELLKGYYPFPMFADLYDAGRQIEVVSDDKDIYSVGAVDEKGTPYLMVVYYSDNEDTAEPKTINLNFDKSVELKGYVLDEAHDMEELLSVSGNTEITMKPNSVILFK